MPTSGRWRLGFGLAVLTAVLWGAVPLAMTPLVQSLDPVTVSWYRYGGAGGTLCLMLLLRDRFRLPRHGGLPALGLFVLAAACLLANTLFYVLAMQYIAAPVVQVVVQIGPVFLMLGSLVVFGERFGVLQWGGFVALVAGIVWFCAERMRVSGAELPRFGFGVGLVFLAATCWAVYGLAQKALLRFSPSPMILVGLYLSGTLVMTPAASPGEAAALDLPQIGLLAFLAANTLVAYSAFAASLEHWESSKVSAVLALQPLVTLFGANLLGRIVPGQFPAMPLTPVILLASVLVVAGSMCCALGGDRR